MDLTPARGAALAVLRAVGRGRRLDLALDEGAKNLDERDRRWVHELTYGVSRLRGRLDHLLGAHLDRAPADLAPGLLDVLRLGAYQLLRMASVPAYAAVSQSVEQARQRGGRGAASLANAVLRRLAEGGEDPSFFPDPAAEPAAWLATWGSHPRWLVDRWLARWTFDDVAALVGLDNQPPPLTVVPLDDAPEEAVARLQQAGIRARAVGRGTGAVEITDDARPAAALSVLPAAVQDPGAALVGRFAAPEPGTFRADLCAAPGGKTLALTRGAAYVLAADRSLPRLRLVRQNLVRTGRRAGLVVARAERPPFRAAPFVLLDAPCTGTGTLRRHPDARWRLRPEDVGRLASVQRAMLLGVADAVAPGGILVYATCTLEPEENEVQVARFLEERADFRLDPPWTVEASLLEDGALAVRPQTTGFDGAYAVRLRRKG